MKTPRLLSVIPFGSHFCGLLLFMIAVQQGLAAPADSSGNDDGQNQAVPLAEAIAEFNHASLADPIGGREAPMTEDEVVAAILLWERETDSPVSEALFRTFKDIATSRRLPGNAAFESLNGYDRGGDHVFDVWSVRIRMDREDGSSYAFVLRERKLRSRTLVEELARLDQLIYETHPEKMVGGYRILDRRVELMLRIEKAAQ
jgi:hypothetical protein